MRPLKQALSLLALALAACADQPTNAPRQAALPEDGAGSGAVEHRTVARGGYGLTFYPGFASRAVVTAAGQAPVELYRQRGGHRLASGAGRASGTHQVVLKGGPFGRELGLTVRDPGHALARIEVDLYGPNHVVGGRAAAAVETLTLEDDAILCPPTCGDSETPPEVEEMPLFSRLSPRAAAPAVAPVVSRAAGYEVSVDPTFASRVVATMTGGRTAELFHQREAFLLPAGVAAPSAEHQVRLRGGPAGRDLTLQLRDPKHHVAAVRLHLYRGRPGAPADSVITVMNGPVLCPPFCPT
jgi:hypothetical protein